MANALAARWLPILEPLGVRRPGDVGWIHGANRSQALLDALSDSKVQFIEGDILLVGGEIIMAHPPVAESDLSFERWLDLTFAAGKGAKLDFKSPEAVVPCLAYAERRAAGKIPLCANADIMAGPGGDEALFRPDEFVSQCKSLLPGAFLSLGWTVEEGDPGYTGAMIDAMLEFLADVDAEVALCFFAGYLPDAWPRVEEILEATDYTLTIWGRIRDIALKTWIRDNTPAERCFYDIQWSDGTQIHLAQS